VRKINNPKNNVQLPCNEKLASTNCNKAPHRCAIQAGCRRLGFAGPAGRLGTLRIRRIDDEFCGGVDI
jgi:hypothetical protein